MELLDASLLGWSRAQFAMTAMYHWLFVPLTLGLGIVMSIMETLYVKTGNEDWKKAAKFWMTLFGVNFALGIATGIILEFEFGTNWSNYSWFVGDIFGAPLAIEAILAFFMEATFISLMFFGWNKLSKKMHLTSTWLTITGATISALWILVANAWMQSPVGMEFNPDMSRNEMISFWSVLLSPVAVNKFFHAVISSWIVGALFTVGVSSWFLLKGRDKGFAMKSIKVGAILGLVASLLTLYTGDGSAYQVAQKQPMKLAAMEGLYNGKTSANLVGFGVLNDVPDYRNAADPFVFKVDVPVPGLLSWLSSRDGSAFVPGVKDIIDGGYDTPKGKALSFAEKQAKGKVAKDAFTNYKKAVAAKDTVAAAQHKATLKENYDYFGYGYFDKAEDLIPNVPMVFYSFHIMVALGMYFILLFIIVLFFVYKKDMHKSRWLLWIALWSIPLGYIAGEAGWIVAEVGRYPWAINGVLPLKAALSNISSNSVILTFFLFLVLFSALLTAEIRIMLKQVKKGPAAH